MGREREGNWDERMTKRVSSQRAALLAWGFGAAGTLLYLVSIFASSLSAQVASGLQSLAFGLLFPAIFSAIWERSMTPALVDEVVAKVHLKHAVDEAGLQDIKVFSDEAWDQILGKAQTLEVYFDIDGSWWIGRMTYLEQAKARGCKIRVLVIDTSNVERRNLMQSLIRFQKHLQDEVTAQQGFYLGLGAQVRRSKQVPMATVVIVDDDIYLRTHRVSSYDPTFIGLKFNTASATGQALCKELDDLWKNGLSA